MISCEHSFVRFQIKLIHAKHKIEPIFWFRFRRRGKISPFSREKKPETQYEIGKQLLLSPTYHMHVCNFANGKIVYFVLKTRLFTLRCVMTVPQRGRKINENGKNSNRIFRFVFPFDYLLCCVFTKRESVFFRSWLIHFVLRISL